MSEDLDLIREALQCRINDGSCDGLDSADYLVVHYVAVVGLYRPNADGSVDTGVVIATPPGQGRYVTDGLLSHADEVLYAAEDVGQDEEL